MTTIDMSRLIDRTSDYVRSMERNGKVVGFDGIRAVSSDPFRFDLELAEIETRGGASLPDHRAIVRADSGAPLGIVGAGYGIVQPSVAADTLDEVVSVTGGKLAAVKVLSNGAALAARIVLPGEVEEARTLNLKSVDFYTANDGTGAYQFSASAYRLSCRNMYAAFAAGTRGNGRQLARVSIRHTRNAANRADVARVVRDLAPAFDQFVRDFDRLMSRTVSLSDRENYYGRLFPRTPITTETGEDLARLLKQNEKAVRTYRTLEEILRAHEEPTAWGALNATTRYIQHERTVRGERDDAEKRIYANLPGGTGHALTVEAQSVALDMWG